MVHFMADGQFSYVQYSQAHLATSSVIVTPLLKGLPAVQRDAQLGRSTLKEITQQAVHKTIKPRHIMSQMHVSFIIPHFKNHFSVLFQTSPLSASVRFTCPDESSEDLSCALDFVLSGRCSVDVAMAHWGKGGKGRPIQLEYLRVYEEYFEL